MTEVHVEGRPVQAGEKPPKVSDTDLLIQISWEFVPKIMCCWACYADHMLQECRCTDQGRCTSVSTVSLASEETLAVQS